VITAVRYRIDAAVICDGTCHWFPLRVLPKLGVKVIPTIHCMLWRKSAPPPGRAMRLIRRLDLPFWRRSANAVMSASGDISRQLDELTAGDHRPVIEFLPTYRHGTFAQDEAPPAFGSIAGQERSAPFRVLFAGRIERNKGVFDILEIARRFHAAGRADIEFDLCGAGSAMEDLKREVSSFALSSTFRLHGHRTRPQMREMFGQSHVLIVPTTSDFAEGFNQVVVEGVLAGRPVITSSICPALEYVRDAIVEVPPDDVGAYHGAILGLLDDRELYDRKRRACVALQEQFYDPERSWATALKKAIGPYPESCDMGSVAKRRATVHGSPV
jgi:glycosyltransferase involved in cell wall biosynthesis